jgi:transcription-repair coupling factor (superfamily II helicase)
MQLPKLSPGKRFSMPRPVGSSDALLLAQLAEREKAAGHPTAVITADATDAQRLLDELAFFAPTLRCALFPDWETLPYDTFSPHQDLISERLATLWRIHNRGHGGSNEEGADVVIVPATTALYRLAPPSLPGGYTFHFKVRAKAQRSQAQSPADAGGLPARHTSGQPR